MGELKVNLIDRVKRTNTIESFRFGSASKVDFLPGQFLQILFDQKDKKNKDLNKYLSFSSSPHQEYIEVTKRLSSSQFSLKLKALKIGDELLIKAPLGSCVFSDNYNKVCFLIGGIGITPLISILEHIDYKKLATDIVLVYSNRSEEDIAFKKELDSWQTRNNLRIYYLISECRPKDLNCIFGVINSELFSKEVPDCCDRHIFVYGPPDMVSTTKELVLGVGCLESKIKVESFVGY